MNRHEAARKVAVFLLRSGKGTAQWRAVEQDRQFTGLADSTKLSDYQVQSWVVYTKMYPVNNNVAENFKSIKIRYYINTSSALINQRNTVIWNIGNYAYANGINLDTRDIVYVEYAKSNVQYSYP